MRGGERKGVRESEREVKGWMSGLVVLEGGLWGVLEGGLWGVLEGGLEGVLDGYDRSL